MTTTPSLLENRWDWIDARRDVVAKSLEELSDDVPKQDRRLLRRLASWFAGDAGLDAAIKRPDVLAICAPLLKCDLDSESSTEEIGRAARMGFCSMGRTLSNRVSLANLILIPLLIFAALVTLTVLFSQFIVPSFEQILLEFGIELPRLSDLMFKMASLIRVTWIYGFVVLAGFAGFALSMNWLTQRQRMAGVSWLEERFKTKRDAAAGWAWHVAMLLASGYSCSESVKIAGKSQHNHWLKRASENWLAQRMNDNQGPTNGVPLFHERYKLLHTTLGIVNPDAQIDLFQEIATNYWTRDRSINQWWSKWVVSLLFWIFVVGIVIVVWCLYSPLFSIVSGLTGGFF